MRTVDGMVFARGSKDDYDRWARVTDDEGWSWNSLFPYMLKVNLYYLFLSLPANIGSIRWNDLLNPSVIGIQQEKSIRRCMGTSVCPLDSRVCRNYPDLTMYTI